MFCLERSPNSNASLYETCFFSCCCAHLLSSVLFRSSSRSLWVCFLLGTNTGAALPSPQPELRQEWHTFRTRYVHHTQSYSGIFTLLSGTSWPFACVSLLYPTFLASADGTVLPTSAHRSALNQYVAKACVLCTFTAFMCIYYSGCWPNSHPF